MPDDLTATELLYATDAYRRAFDSRVVGVDEPAHAVALEATTFFPTGGGQPPQHRNAAPAVRRGGGHRRQQGPRRRHLAHARRRRRAARPGDAGPRGARLGAPLPAHAHAPALHVLNGVIWLDHGAQVTGVHMTPGEGRLDFELPALSQQLARAVEARVNEQVQRDLRGAGQPPFQPVALCRGSPDEWPSRTSTWSSETPLPGGPLGADVDLPLIGHGARLSWGAVALRV